MPRYIIFLISVIVIFPLLSCEKTDLNSIENLNQGNISVIGHGGVGFPSIIPFNAIPTNSASAFMQAINEYNADGVELDIHMTKDFDFVLYHDKTLDTKTGKSGYVEDFALKDLSEIQYQLGFPYDLFQSEMIIGLDSAMKLFKSFQNFPILQIDIRHYAENKSPEENVNWENKLADELLFKLHGFDLDTSKVKIISISKTLCLYFLNNTSFPVSYEIKDLKEFDWVKKNQIKSVTINAKILTTEFSAKAHANGVEVIAFGSKSRSGNLDLIKKNPDQIQTDNLSALNNLLKRR